MPKHLTVLPKPDTPTPRKSGMPEPKLDSLRGIRSEMAALYRSSRYRGEIDASDLAKYIYTLRQIAEIVEATDFEDRLKRLEQHHD